MFNIIYKPDKNYSISPNSLVILNKDYKFCDNNFILGEFSKINVFIGENNSGKSRFLRFLYSSDYRIMSILEFDKFYNEMQQRLYQCKLQRKVSIVETFNDAYIKAKGNNYYHSSNSFFESSEKNSRLLDKTNRYYFPILRGFKDYKGIIDSKLKEFLKISTGSIQNKDSINHYISLLNLEEKGLQDFDVYRQIIAQEYFKDKRDSIGNILTGGKLYQEIKSMLLGNAVQRKIIADFQVFLRDYFFREYDSVLFIPKEAEKILYVKIGNDERPIYDWGDGTQQLIIILYFLFIHKDEENKVFFIEEPEMYLHPGILRKFTEVINLDIFKNHQYFITTHSNIILDTSADANIDMSIFKFKKVKNRKDEEAEFVVEQCNNGDTSLLNELGVRNSSVFLSNCSIWVEGITDRLYLKHYLNLYVEKHPEKTRYRENIDFTFIEYGGGNITHFNFENKNAPDNINARYINSKIFLIADNDNSAPSTAKGIRKARYKEVLGENFYELGVMEIENLISKDILKDVLIHQNLDKIELINCKFTKELKFEHQKLGRYLDNLFKGEIRKYAGDSGTIKNKLDFCNTVIKATTDYDSLSEEAKILVEKIYHFIEENN